MPPGTNQFNSLFITNAEFVFKIGVVAFVFLYFVFTLIVIRQVSLMTETIRTEAGGFLKFISILYALSALGLVVFFFLLL
jgi:hypothetical protein